MASLNDILDTLPRTRVGRLWREGPAFRACGVSGFHVAVAAALAGGLLAGRSLPVVAIVCLTSALSFFAYTYLRRFITGRETLVLLEHVWFAEACVAGVMAALGEPVLACLDVIGPALALFLAAGRVGCLLAGCCHGHPSPLGIAYPEGHVHDGFPEHWAGVRLCPVQAVEALGLLAIGVTGLAALPFAAEGRVFAWFLAAYAVLRFGTEGLRGDRRPHLLGMSVPRWMALAELGVALWITRGAGDPRRDAALLAGVAAALVIAGIVARALDRRRGLLAPAHLRELRNAVRAASAGGAARTEAGVSVAVAPHPDGPDLWLRVSLAADGARDVEGMCRMAAAALPAAHAPSARMDDAGVLHLAVPAALPETGPHPPREAGDVLYAAVARRLQAESAREPETAPGRAGVFIPRRQWSAG
jgi:hypothetical protein